MRYLNSIVAAFEIESWGEMEALIGIAIVLGGGLFSLLRWLNRHRLSSKQREILKHAVERGDILVMPFDGGPTWVRSGNADLGKEEDRGDQTIYVDDLQDLVQRGFAEALGKDYYRLTGAGFQAAKKLVARIRRCPCPQCLKR